MDVMSLRRGLMAQMEKGGSIFDEFLEIVDAVTPESEVYEIEFHFDLIPGIYFISANPPVTRQVAALQSQAQSFCGGTFQLRGIENGSITVATSVSLTYLKQPSATQEVDYWTSNCTLTNSGIIYAATANRFPLIAGYTYYLFRAKGI